MRAPRAELSRCVRIAVLCAWAWITPHVAHAYRNPARFIEPAEDGGGGGKYFTGSRAEGYTCAVCHSTGEPVATSVSGLPIDGYIPGQVYPVTIDWPDELRSVALNVELTDYDGNPFGELYAADPASVSPLELCKDSQVPANGQELPAQANGRRVLTVAECGQAQTTFVWRAPQLATRGYMTASIVFSNRDSKLGGDRVSDISRAFGPMGESAPSVDAFSGGCATEGRRTAPSADCLVLLGVLFAAQRTRRRKP